MYLFSLPHGQYPAPSIRNPDQPAVLQLHLDISDGFLFVRMRGVFIEGEIEVCTRDVAPGSVETGFTVAAEPARSVEVGYAGSVVARTGLAYSVT